jgi:Lon protease-like protein
MIQEDVIAIFPLPNLVFFPKTNLPLHIFEPRYCEMVKETIQNKQLIGMFVLQPGWQDDYYGNPPVHSVGCAGELIHFEQLAEGNFNIILRGLYRARAIGTVQEFPYRKARVEVLPEVLVNNSRSKRAVQDLLVDFRKLEKENENSESLEFSNPFDLQEVVNSIASTLQLEVDFKLQLLQENDVLMRARNVHELIKKHLSVFGWTRQFTHLRPKDPTQN